jgi:hypothetical protein
VCNDLAGSCSRVQPLHVQVVIVRHKRRRLHLLHRQRIQERGRLSGGDELNLRAIRQLQAQVHPVRLRLQHRQLRQQVGHAGVRKLGFRAVERIDREQLDRCAVAGGHRVGEGVELGLRRRGAGLVVHVVEVQGLRR